MDLKTTSPWKTYSEEGKNKPSNTTTEDLGFGYLHIKDLTHVTLHANKNYENKKELSGTENTNGKRL